MANRPFGAVNSLFVPFNSNGIVFYPEWTYFGTDPKSWDYTVTPRYTSDGITWVSGEPVTYHFTDRDYTTSGWGGAIAFRARGQTIVPPAGSIMAVFAVEVSDGTNVYSVNGMGEAATVTAYTRPTVAGGTIGVYVNDSAFLPYGGLAGIDLDCGYLFTLEKSSEQPMTVKFAAGYPFKKEMAFSVEQGQNTIRVSAKDLLGPFDGETAEISISVNGVLDAGDLWRTVTFDVVQYGEIPYVQTDVSDGVVDLRLHRDVIGTSGFALFGTDSHTLADRPNAALNTHVVFEAVPFDAEQTIMAVIFAEPPSGVGLNVRQVSYIRVTVPSNDMAMVNYGDNMAESIAFMGEPAVSYSTALSQNVYSVAGQTLPKAFYGKSAKRSMTFTAKGTNVESPAEIDRKKLEALAIAGDAILRMPGGVTHKVAVQSVSYGYGYGNKVTGITIPMVEVQ